VLAVALRDDPTLARGLRVIAWLGPSTIQPVVAARRLPAGLKAALRAILLGLGRDLAARPCLAHGFIERFVGMVDSSYDDIRAMLAVVDSASLLHATLA
jgi:ABC-type phosphate/phosphonate transport system substrate-binding protein